MPELNKVTADLAKYLVGSSEQATTYWKTPKHHLQFSQDTKVKRRNAKINSHNSKVFKTLKRGATYLWQTFPSWTVIHWWRSLTDSSAVLLRVFTAPICCVLDSYKWNARDYVKHFNYCPRMEWSAREKGVKHVSKPTLPHLQPASSWNKLKIWMNRWDLCTLQIASW